MLDFENWADENLDEGFKHWMRSAVAAASIANTATGGVDNYVKPPVQQSPQISYEKEGKFLSQRRKDMQNQGVPNRNSIMGTMKKMKQK